MLKAIRINNVKSIRNIENSFELNNLGKINYLLGKNGSGKSTVLEVLLSIYELTNSVSATEDKLRRKYSVKPKKNKSLKKYFLTLLTTPLLKLYNDDYLIELEFENSIYIYSHINQEERLFSEKFLKDNDEFVEIFFYAPIAEKDSTDFSKINAEIEKYNNQKSQLALVNLLNFVLCEFGEDDEIILEENGGKENYIFKKNREIVSFSLLSSGVKQYLVLYQFIKKQIRDAVNSNKIPHFLNQAHICFLLDEFETPFHPSIQKRIPKLINSLFEDTLYEDLDKDSIIKERIQFFICTHSPFILNASLEIENSKIYHLKNGQIQVNDSINDYFINNILNDIGCKPSDLFMANGIIWVEGPSDIVFIEEWLEIYRKQYNKKKYIKGLHYDYAIYGGNILKYYHLYSQLHLDSESLKYEQEKFINLISLNPNFYIVFDNDLNRNLKAFGEAKQYIIKLIEQRYEFLKKPFWYENNPSINTIENYFKMNNRFSHFFVSNKKKKYDSIFKKGSKELSKSYCLTKGKNSMSIIYYWELKLHEKPTFDDFEPELETRILELYKFIEEWNTIG